MKSKRTLCYGTKVPFSLSHDWCFYFLICIALGCFCSLTCFVEAHVFFGVNIVFFCVQNTNMCVVKMMTFATCNIDFWLFCNLWYWHFLKNYCIIFVKILVLVLIRFVWPRRTKKYNNENGTNENVGWCFMLITLI